MLGLQLTSQPFNLVFPLYFTFPFFSFVLVWFGVSALSSFPFLTFCSWSYIFVFFNKLLQHPSFTKLTSPSLPLQLIINAINFVWQCSWHVCWCFGLQWVWLVGQIFFTVRCIVTEKLRFLFALPFVAWNICHLPTATFKLIYKFRKHIGRMTAPSSAGSMFSGTGIAFMTEHHLSTWAWTETMEHVRDHGASLYLLMNCPTDLACASKTLPAGIMLALIPKVVRSCATFIHSFIFHYLLVLWLWSILQSKATFWSGSFRASFPYCPLNQK